MKLVAASSAVLAWMGRDSGPAFLAMVMLLATLATSDGDWISFPLSRALNAGDIEFTILGVAYAAKPLLWVALFASALIFPFHRGLSALLALMALVTVLLVPIHAAFDNPDWISAYLDQSWERQKYQSFVAEQFILNLTLEPTYIPMTEFDGVAEQAMVGMVMMDWGWYLTTGAMFVYFLIVLKYWRSAHRVSLALLVCVMTTVLVAGQPIASVVRSAYWSLQGDRALMQGRAEQALNAYRLALRENPTLVASDPFVIKVSLAYDSGSAGMHPLRVIGRALDLSNKAADKEYIRVYGEARKLLLETASLAKTDPEDKLLRAMLALVDKLNGQLWLSEGIAAAQSRQYALALDNIQRSGAAGVMRDLFLAQAYLAQGGALQAVSLLQRLQGQITNPSILSDLLCTKGDAYTRAGMIVEARQEYVSCQSYDKYNNFRAARALSGL